MPGFDRHKVQNFIKYLYKCVMARKQKDDDMPQPAEERDKNPYIGQIREIMEQILEKKSISYEMFVPIIIDGRDSKYALMTAELLGRDLNRLIIFTDRPAYFEEYADNMYEEHGLIVEIFLKNLQKIAGLSSEAPHGSVILDFEEKSEFIDIKFEKIIYIPVFKRQWEQTGNLDIAVPIGYNTMIVRGNETLSRRHYTDKFERAFYENE